MELTIEGRKFIISSENPAAPAVWIPVDGHEGEEIIAAYRGLDAPACSIIAIDTPDWNDALSPWEMQPLGKGQQAFGGHAKQFLRDLCTKWMPEIYEKAELCPSAHAIAGYSLAGLFALYALTETEAFSYAASVSGSLWYPDFRAYLASHPLRRMPEGIYLSLGDAEPRTRHPILRTVGEETEAIAQDFAARGIPCRFEWNPGNHFMEPALRTAKGIAWLMQKQAADHR